jgi:predicted dehydrogenase
MSGLRVGVVGMGIGQLHLLSWLGVEGADAVAFAEPDDARRSKGAADWGIEAVSSLDELLALGVDIVDLCTPPHLHEQQVIRCLEAGAHVICEKPLVDSVAACERLQAAADGAPGRFMPIFQYRFGPGAHQARALVEAGLTGPLYLATAETTWRRGAGYYAEAPWRGTWAGERGGCVLSHAIHNHDLLQWIGGSFTSVHARTAVLVNPVETEDCAVATATTADGGLATMAVTLGAATEASRLRWCFQHVTIESNHEAYDPARGPWTFEFPDPEVAAAAEAVWAALPAQGRQYTGQFQRFVDGLGSDEPPPVTLDDARAALELITGWYHSARTGAVVPLPLAADHPDRASWLPPELR